jgi:hypothetical protein
MTLEQAARDRGENLDLLIAQLEQMKAEYEKEKG